MGAVEETMAIFAARGGEFHGEVIDQRSHALQCAELAQAAGAADLLVAAALLHDIGHLIAARDQGRRGDLAVDDDHHESVGARWVAPRFGRSTAQAIALHVVAKRYQCTIDPAYAASLSPASVQTLRAQGGLLDVEAISRFEHHPGCSDARALRTWDEAAKDPERTTGGIEQFVPLLERLALTSPDHH